MAIPLYAKIHAVSYLIPTATGFTRFAKLDRAMRILTILTLFACLELVAQYLVALWLGNNLFLSHFYVLLEFSMLCMVFYWSVPLRSTRNTLLMAGGSFVAFWAADLIYFFDPGQINTVSQMVDRIVIVVMAAITLQAVVKDETTILTRRPVFWVAISVILYSAGSLVAVGLGNQLLALGRSYFDVAWYINWTLIIIANLLYAKGLLCASKP